jgi:hypothetical protein
MLYLAALPAYSAAPLVDANINPAQIAVGESAQLTISTLGSGIEAVTLPVVPGLEFRVVEQSRRIELVHGASVAMTTTVVRVTPYVAGTFIIPGMSPKSQPLVLRVSPDDGSLKSNRFGPPGRAPVGAGGSQTSDIRMTEDGSAYLRLILPKREAYVGESIPVAIELGGRAGSVASLNGLPTLIGGDFTLNNLPRQPDRTEKIIDGAPFVLLTWHTVLAAIKPGTFSVSVQTPITVKISTRPKQEAEFEDRLGDPFLQRIFGATVRKDINVASPTYELTVQSLPTDGRPPEFSGAVGTFNIAIELSPAIAAAGDPLTLRMRITGAGNFDRVDSAMLEHVDHWKVYPPKSKFTASDAIGYKGEKIFEQPVIASKPGAQMLPGLAFNYFDPTTRRYETARSPSLSVMISPSLADSIAATAGVAASGGTNPANQSHSGLRPDHVVAESRRNTLVPLDLQPGFLAIPSLLGAAFAGGWLALRRSASDPHHNASARDRGISKAAKRALAQMEAAGRSGDTALFLNAARAALVDARIWMTAADLDARFGNDADDIRRLFALADELRYSGGEPGTVDIARWTRIVRRQLLREKAL